MEVSDELRPVALFSKLESVFDGGVARLRLIEEGDMWRIVGGDFVMERFVWFTKQKLRREVEKFCIALLNVSWAVYRFTQCGNECNKNCTVSF